MTLAKKWWGILLESAKGFCEMPLRNFGIFPIGVLIKSPMEFPLMRAISNAPAISLTKFWETFTFSWWSGFYQFTQRFLSSRAFNSHMCLVLVIGPCPCACSRLFMHVGQRNQSHKSDMTPSLLYIISAVEWYSIGCSPIGPAIGPPSLLFAAYMYMDETPLAEATKQGPKGQREGAHRAQSINIGCCYWNNTLKSDGLY